MLGVCRASATRGHYSSSVMSDYRWNRTAEFTERRIMFSTINAAGTFAGMYTRYTKRHYNAPGSSLFRIAYTLDTFSPLFFFFASIPPWNETAMHAHCPLARPFHLSFSFTRSLSSLLALTLRFSLPLSVFLSFPCPSHPKLNAFATVSPLLASFFSFPTVFLPLPQLQTLEPHLASPYQLFLICYTVCAPALPHLLFSYQPGRTRIHILQAFMMAAAHLCEPACLAASSLPRAGSPLSNQSDTGSAQAL